MPGLNYYFSKNLVSSSKDKILNSMECLLNLDQLSNEILIEEDLQILSSTKYDSYPIENCNSQSQEKEGQYKNDNGFVKVDLSLVNL